MKTKSLYIIRHAKAEDHSLAKNDFVRNIVQKGIDRTNRILPLLVKDLANKTNLLVISSTANRAIQTAELIVNQINYSLRDIKQTKNIYEAHYKNILMEINAVSDHIDTLIVVGHNPGLSDLVYYLTDSYINLNTSAIAKIVVEENMNFSELSASTAHLIEVYSE